MNHFLISMPGGMEWIFIIAVVLLLFGGKKIPELMKGLGNGIREFKNASKDKSEDTKQEQKNLENNKGE